MGQNNTKTIFYQIVETEQNKGLLWKYFNKILQENS